MVDGSVIVLEMKKKTSDVGRVIQKETNALMEMLAEQAIPEKGLRDLFYEPIRSPNSTTRDSTEMYSPQILFQLLSLPSSSFC